MLKKMLTPTQQELLMHSEFHGLLAQAELEEFVSLSSAKALSDVQLLSVLQIANFLYRQGEAVLSDQQYDHIFLAELKHRYPEHEYLQSIEVEPALGAKTVTLPQQMLSTEKAYTLEQIERWLQRVLKAAEGEKLDPSSLQFKMTSKLDGFAAFDDGQGLYTRGDGRKGTDITRVFERGLQVAGNGERGQGAGEIVIHQEYFATHLADSFENARNFQASIIKEKELEEHALAAIAEGAAVFYPFAQLPAWQGDAATLLADFERIFTAILNAVPYDVDGVVIEVLSPEVKHAMGATRHHHRWQIAYKQNNSSAEVLVISVMAQTSRSGRVNPVVELQPTRLSGALISRATAHHYGMVRELGIGPGTLIELTRSGLVIPKIERVISPQAPQIPDTCPSCASALVWDSDYLYCLNSAHCPAQIETSLEHFFRTLGNIDGFGGKTIVKLHAAGVDSIYAIYQLQFSDLQGMGFGDKTAQNLLDQLQRSRSEQIEDWRFLGAFGIHRMGLGNCERLLQHHRLLDIFSLQLPDIIAIEGFAEKTAAAMLESLQKLQADFMQIYQLGFNLQITPLLAEVNSAAGPLFGKQLVFTGTMQQGSRDAMQKQAKALGAKVGSTVTQNTDFLVIGDKVGATKINAAREKGVQILTEAEYFALLDLPAES